MTRPTENRTSRTLLVLTLTLMIGYFILGCVLFDGYGSGPDEGIERQTSLVNFRYTIERFAIPVPDSWTGFLSYLPDLKEYRDRYYGTALHQPLVLIEAFADFKLPPAVFYRMRHFYTFLNWYAATIVFYLLLRKRFRNPWAALCGWLVLVLTPRFFAESFYNNKDILFTAWTIFSLYAIDHWMSRRTVGSALAAGLILAFTVNTRLNGLAYLPIGIGIAIIDAVARKEKVRTVISQAGWICVVFLAALILITPNLWNSPIETLVETFRFSADHPNHTAHGNLFFGKLIDASMSRSYIATWIALTTPSEWLILAFTGGILFLMGFKRKNRCDDTRTDFLVLLSGLIPALVIILRHVTIYNTWRHCYFVYPTIVYFAAFAIDRITRRIEKIQTVSQRNTLAGICALILSAAFIVNAAWIAANHPYQFAYFAPWAREQAESFSGDYWGIATRQLLEEIVTRDSSPWIQVNHLYTQTGSINRGNLPDQDRVRLDLSYEITDDTDYILFSRDEKTFDPGMFPGFEVWYEIRVDGALVGAVLKRCYSAEHCQSLY